MQINLANNSNEATVSAIGKLCSCNYCKFSNQWKQKTEQLLHLSFSELRTDNYKWKRKNPDHSNREQASFIYNSDKEYQQWVITLVSHPQAMYMENIFVWFLLPTSSQARGVRINAECQLGSCLSAVSVPSAQQQSVAQSPKDPELWVSKLSLLLSESKGSTLMEGGGNFFYLIHDAGIFKLAVRVSLWVLQFASPPPPTWPLPK